MKEDYKYKISVIVPVYNVEKYLEETIESVIAQTLGFKNIQLILVNDGSPDNSVSIMKEYAKKDSRVKCIEKENGGYGSVNFEWKMKDGINETKGIGIPNPVYSGSGFTTRSSWQVTNSDGNIIYYIFDLQIR